MKYFNVNKIIDFLLNSIEFCSDEESIEILKKMGLSEYKSKKIVNFWWQINAKKRINMTDKEIIEFLKNQIEGV